ncbi:MAG TPA: hypothetical protein VK509_01330, partial [Polyangiales bacterium]|nr:hypothetical protein [Polyangiales bacterium]
MLGLLACSLAYGAACGGDDDDDDSSPSAGTGGQSGKGGSGDAGKGGSGDAGKGGAGSGSGGGSAAGSSGGAGQGGPRTSSAGLVGDLQIELLAEKAPTPSDPDGTEAVTRVLGLFNDAAKPIKIQLVLSAEAGDCKLYEPEVPSCEANCTLMDATCTADDVCTPNPKPQDVGNIHLTVGSASSDLPCVAKNYQLKAGEKLPYPPCMEGESVKIDVEGGAFEPFAIETRCIGELEVGGPFAIEPGKPLALTWSEPGDETVARMQIRLDISHHGGSKGEIKCDVPDSGAFEIPSELTDKLLDLGVAGFPTVQLTRAAIGKPKAEPSKVTLSMTMFAEREVTIPGLVSCA